MTAAARGAGFALTHRTTYTFDRPVSMAPHEIRLRPAPHAHARITGYSLAIEPAAHTLHWQQDAYANWVARLTFPGRASALVLDVEVAGELVDANPFDFFVDPAAATFPFVYAPAVERALAPYLAGGDNPCRASGNARLSPADSLSSIGNSSGSGEPQLSAWLAAFRATIVPAEQTVGLLVRINGLLKRDVAYEVRDEQGVQHAETTLVARRGSCRDSAWLLIRVLRELGIAARFVSGYLVELASGTGTRDSGSLHAWAEAFVPGAGWIGLDPTSGLLAAAGHVPLACAADPEMAAPVSGTTDVCNVAFAASIEVRSIGTPATALR